MVVLLLGVVVVIGGAGVGVEAFIAVELSKAGQETNTKTDCK